MRGKGSGKKITLRDFIKLLCHISRTVKYLTNIILNFIKFIITADVKITGILGKEVKIPPDCLARISQPQRKNSSFMPRTVFFQSKQCLP